MRATLFIRYGLTALTSTKPIPPCIQPRPKLTWNLMLLLRSCKLYLIISTPTYYSHYVDIFC